MLNIVIVHLNIEYQRSVFYIINGTIYIERFDLVMSNR